MVSPFAVARTRIVDAICFLPKIPVQPPHFIQELTFEHNGKAVFVADWGPAVSKDPYVKFSFKGASKGDDLKISWVDNKGASDTTTAKIQ